MTKQQVLDIASNGINYLGTMASLVYAPANDSNTGAKGAVMGTLSGAAAGASLGSVIPGIGTAAGAIVGGIGGFLTSAFKKGNVTTNGFYLDPTMQKGGIFANNRKLRRRYNWAKDVVQANRAGLVSSELAEYNWLQDHDADVTAFANGGVTSSLVYGNDGELVKLPNGDMKQFAELGLPTDSQLALLPNGSKILNKKDSENITERMKSSKYKDKYALGTDAANKLIASIQFDQAFDKQEAEKAKKGIKPKYKQLASAFDLGGYTGKRYSRKPVKIAFDKYFGPVIVNDDGTKTMLDKQYYDSSGVLYTVATPPQDYPKWKYYEEPYGKFGFNSDKNEYFLLNPDEEETSSNARAFFGQLTPASQTPQSATTTQSESSVVPASSYSSKQQATTTPAATTVTSTTKTTPSKSSGRKAAVSKPVTKSATTTPTPQVVAPEVETVIDEDLLDFRPDLQPVSGYTPTIKKPTTDKGGDDTTSGRGFDWGSLISRFGSLGPILSNLMVTPETVRANYNPYETAILNTMRRRRYDVSSAIEDLNRNRATSNYNASQFNTNTGANLAYRLQSAVNTDRAIANLRTMENNYNNQYLADYANMANNLGQQRVAADNLNDDLNAQNRAAADNIVATAKSNLAGWFNNNELMSNLRERDMEMLPLYSALLNAGTKYEDYRDLMENNTRHIRRKKNKKGGKKNGSELV